jgi:hypothetical protein
MRFVRYDNKQENRESIKKMCHNLIRDQLLRKKFLTHIALLHLITLLYRKLVRRQE